MENEGFSGTEDIFPLIVYYSCLDLGLDGTFFVKKSHFQTSVGVEFTVQQEQLLEKFHNFPCL